jgi:non-specific serine/threonine protein kinase
LPTPLVPLIGREAVVAATRTALSSERIVTLVGEAGIGKTRTALHVAAGVLDDFSGGVWYVELSTIVDSAHVAAKLLADLGLREMPGRAPLESALLWLATREALVVLDNCEQIVAEAARIVRAIAERCPKVRILSTSREALGVYGERTVQMPPLAVPEAIALFGARAVAANPRFALSDGDAVAVGEICRRLGGIALAIELAASRANVLAPPHMLAMLDERFRFLSVGTRHAQGRQRTLDGATAWSYDLLSQRERRIFERAGVFAGRWPLEAALAVCAEDVDVIDVVEALVNASLIAMDGDSHEKQYRSLEPIRSFAHVRLAERGELEEIRARHAAYALAVSERLDAEYLLLPTAMWERSTTVALADLRAAISWTLDGNRDLVTGITIIANLRWFWSGIAPSEGTVLVRRARVLAAQCELPIVVRGKLAIAEAVLATGLGDYRTQRDAAYRARQAWHAAGDELEHAIADRTYAQALLSLGDEREGLPILEAALAVLRQHGCGVFASLALDTLGVHHFARGDIVTARGCLTEAIALARAAGFERGLLFFNVNLAEIEALSGNVDAAIALCRASLDRTYAKRELYTFALAWSNLAMYYSRLDRWDEALEAATAGFQHARESGIASFAAFALQTIAAVLVFRGDAHDGARLAGYVDARIAEIGFERGATENAQYQRLLARARAIVGRGDVDAELTRGRALSPDDALQLAGFARHGFSP